MGVVWATVAAAPTADSEGVVGDMKWGMEREKQRLRKRKEGENDRKGEREEERKGETEEEAFCSLAAALAVVPSHLLTQGCFMTRFPDL